jgi:ABC-2 type transport system ATP-binding protein
MHTLVTEEVTKRYAGHTALDKVSIAVPEGSIFGLLGPNGAGKTTLIRIINMITGPDEGRVYFDGKPIRAEDISRIGYLPEERGLYKKMKVGEQAVYLARLKGMSKQEATRQLKTWFEKFDITAWWNRKVEELSKGMQQKVQFIVTVLHQPRLLIFDEPFSGFDPINTALLKQEILRLRQEGSTIIFSTHNMASVEELCDNIALINRSHKILDGSVDEIRNRYRSNIFELEHATPPNLAGKLPAGFSILSESANNGNYRTQVQLPPGIRPNDLLAVAIRHLEVSGFREILPTMNDIFIQTVKGSAQ